MAIIALVSLSTSPLSFLLQGYNYLSFSCHGPITLVFDMPPLSCLYCRHHYPSLEWFATTDLFCSMLPLCLSLLICIHWPCLYCYITTTRSLSLLPPCLICRDYPRGTTFSLLLCYHHHYLYCYVTTRLLCITILPLAFAPFLCYHCLSRY